MKLILASSSPRRVELLKQIHFTPDEIMPADIDESVLKDEKPIQYVKRVSAEKAQKIFEQFPEDVVIAADTTVYARAKYLGKPENEDEAREYLQMLSGRTHRVYSGISVFSQKSKSTKFCLTRVKFKRISKQEMNLIIDSGEWKGKSGAYMIQGIASCFVKNINGSVTNVVGLPLYEANNMLRAHGLKPNSL